MATVRSLQLQHEDAAKDAKYSKAQAQWVEQFSQSFHDVFSTQLFPEKLTCRLFDIPSDAYWSLVTLVYESPKDVLAKFEAFVKCAKKRQMPAEKDYKELFSGKMLRTSLPHDSGKWEFIRRLHSHAKTYEQHRASMEKHKAVGVFIHVWCPRLDSKTEPFDAAACLTFEDGTDSQRETTEFHAAQGYKCKQESSIARPKYPDNGKPVIKEWAACCATEDIKKTPEPHELWDLQKQVCRGCKKSKTELQLKSLMRCTGCKSANYCSKECQRAHWEAGHREMCKDEAACAYFASDVLD